jgi:type II secretory pathway predicted ATPase ExeA
LTTVQKRVRIRSRNFHQLRDATSSGQQELRARLTYLLRETGIGLVTGEVGSGKSTALRAFAEGLDPNRYLVLYLANPALGMTGVYRDMATNLGLSPAFFKPQMVAQIRQALQDLYLQKRRAPVILFDEAHLLGPAMLEELRLLLNHHMDAESLATLVLVGHSELRRKLRLSIHEALFQRLAVRYHLGPLDLEETAAYIKHHVRVAGYTGGQLFSDDFVTKAFDYTKGIPRKLNVVCIHALMAGFVERKQILDEGTLRKVINDLEMD